MKFLYLFSVIILFLGLALQAQEKNNAIQWIHIEHLSDSLSVKPKKVLFFLHTDWCSYCRKMLKETFRSKEIVERINRDYYAVHIDAETTDTIRYNGEIYINSSQKKRTGSNHEFVTALMGQRKPIFPTTIILDTNMNVVFFEQKYLSIKEFLFFL